MNWQSVKQFLKPERRRLLLFAIFVAIAVLLRPLPTWPMCMFLLNPSVLVVSTPLEVALVDVMRASPWLFIAASLIYFYLLSCLVIVALDWAKARWESWRV